MGGEPSNRLARTLGERGPVARRRKQSHRPRCPRPLPTTECAGVLPGPPRGGPPTSGQSNPQTVAASVCGFRRAFTPEAPPPPQHLHQPQPTFHPQPPPQHLAHLIQVDCHSADVSQVFYVGALNRKRGGFSCTWGRGHVLQPSRLARYRFREMTFKAWHQGVSKATRSP